MKHTITGDLKREMGLGSAIILVVASMVGTGIFTTPGFIIEEVGSSQALLLCWLIGGLFALAGALCYGELGAMMPEAGGEYVYLRYGFGPLWAFISGWISLIVGFSAPLAAAAIAFATYFTGGERDIWFSIGFGNYRLFSVSPSILLAISAVLVLSFAHYHSLKLGKRVQNVLTVFKLGFLFVFIASGLFFGNGNADRLAMTFSGMRFDGLDTGFAVALIFVSFAYSGWNAASYLGGEIRRPERNLPLALLIGTTLVSLIYVLLNLVYIYALPGETMGGMLEVGIGAAHVLFGPAAAKAVGLAISFGLLSVMSAMIMAGPRVYYAMARDGLFFQIFGHIDPKRHTPVYSVALQSGIAIVMIVSASFDTLLIYIGFTLSLISMMTVAGLIRLRMTQPDLPRPYRTFGYPLTPIIFIAGNLGIIVYSFANRPVAAVYGLLTLCAGGIAYTFFRKKT